MTAVAIFVKTPGLSPIKTRLAKDWGRERAETWHRLAAASVAASAQAAHIGPVYWAIAEPEGMEHSLWSGLPGLNQGSGKLGARMARVLAWLVRHHGSGLLLGADAPQWDPAWLRQAADWLQADSPRLCLGPARDGGFWTFGANRPLNTVNWDQIRYSQPETGQRFRQLMDAQGDWLTLPTLCDLDESQDLPTVLAELEALQNHHAAHRCLLAWVRQTQASK
ncbi:MAG: TIGR04282 family arsenosugar biosynthesis glycosyltransferase [Wenzhouxiangella sp.]